MLAFVEQIKTSAQLFFNNAYRFQAKVKFQIEMGPYLIKTAETMEELISCFHLRYEVFNKEFKGETDDGLDFDKFDFIFDHLMITHKETDQVIGTYRLSCSTFSDRSYTGKEFDLSMLKLNQGPFLELGRACIQKEYRKGSTLSLLWRGIAEYVNQTQANIIFGCSTIKTNCPREAALTYKYLYDQNHLAADFISRPTRKFSMPNFDLWYAHFQNGLSERQIEEAANLIPSLLKSYLKVGAKVACEPAFDVEFNCIDYLTVLKKSDLSDALASKFQVTR